MFDKLKNTTCPAPISDAEAKPLSIGITTQRLLTYISIPCAAISSIACLYLIFKHLHRYTRPAEQRQIVRLIFTPVIYSILAVLSLLFYDAHEYIEPLPELYEAFALACLFVLFAHFCRNPTVRDTSGFTRAKTRNEFESIADIKKTWILVFQYPIVKTILIIAQEASTATGTYCAASNSIHFGHIWITVIGSISLVVCFMTILRFYKVNKHLMTVHKPLAKLASFKLIVFVIFLQNLVFNFIPTPKGLSSNGTVSPRDIKYGIPSFLVCVEMVFFSFFFHFSFRSRLYHPSERGTGAAMSLPAAAFDAINPSDLVMDIAQMFTTGPVSAGYMRTQSPAAFAQNSPAMHPLVPPSGGAERPVSPVSMPPPYDRPYDPAYSQHLSPPPRR